MTEAFSGAGRSTPSPFPRRLLRVPTAAQAADVSRSTIYRAVNDGSLEMVRIGKISAITAESFDRWIAGLPRVAAKNVA